MKGISLLFALILILACNSDDTITPAPPELDLINFIQVVKDMDAYAPLTAKVYVETSQKVKIILRVIGQHGEDSDVIFDFQEFNTTFEVPVLGLYPDLENEVEIIFLNEGEEELDRRHFFIQTDPLIKDMPEIEIDIINQGGVKKGFTFVNYFGHSGQFFPQRAFLFDGFGDIRWYLDFRNHPVLSGLFYDNGMVRLQNGNLIFGDGNTQFLYEINWLGEIQNEWSLHGYGFHHTVIEKPNGNFLVTVNDWAKPTREDVIIEIDRFSKEIINTWDLTKSLDKHRRAWETDLADLNVDWFHANGLGFSSIDNSIIVSGRTQGLVKLNENNQVVWILAPHKDWGFSGNGKDLNQYLLTPEDNQGTPITDPQVLEGYVNHPEFEWAWYQHSPILLPNGNVMVFDNGENRNYNWSGNYSRAAEFEINENNMTVRQVWTYGKERGEQTFSRIVSKVQYHDNENNVLFAPGAIYLDKSYGKVIEVNKLNSQVLFEAKIIPPIAPFNITFHSVFRVNLSNR